MLLYDISLRLKHLGKQEFMQVSVNLLHTFTHINPTSFESDTLFYRGISKLDLNQTASGCLDLSKARELGHSEAYVYIIKYCK